jgi:hypothetical protein
VRFIFLLKIEIKSVERALGDTEARELVPALEEPTSEKPESTPRTRARLSILARRNGVTRVLAADISRAGWNSPPEGHPGP